MDSCRNYFRLKARHRIQEQDSQISFTSERRKGNLFRSAISIFFDRHRTPFNGTCPEAGRADKLLSEFLQDLFEYGRVRVSAPDTSTDTDLAAAAEVLKRAEEIWRQSLPSNPPEFIPEVALWAADRLYNAAQFLVFRHVEPEIIRQSLKRREPAPVFDQAYFALLTDLNRSGLLDSTLVVFTTEFGRKPDFDGNGRGHHPLCFSTVLAGGGVKPGYVHGKSDARGHDVDTDRVSVAAFHATIGWSAGLPIEKEAITLSGRPFTVGDSESPIPEVFA